MQQDLDISWIDDDVQELEKESMSSIQIYTIYVDEDTTTIQSVSKSTFNLEQTLHDGSTIPIDKLLYMIHKMKTHGKLKYRLSEILLFNLDFLDSNILKHCDQELKTNPLIKRIFNSISNYKISDIHIPPSLCIFHDINCLYFIFQEIEQDIEPTTTKPKLKILNEISMTLSHKKTKKVTFKEDFRHTKRKETI